MEIGDRLKKRRLDLGKTLIEVAEIIGVREATVQRYESGSIKNLKQDTIIKLADALNTTPAYLMGWEAESKEERPIIKNEPTTPTVADSDIYALSYGGGGSKVPKSDLEQLMKEQEENDDEFIKMKLQIIKHLRESDYTKENLKAIDTIVLSLRK